MTAALYSLELRTRTLIAMQYPGEECNRDTYIIGAVTLAIPPTDNLKRQAFITPIPLPFSATIYPSLLPLQNQPF